MPRLHANAQSKLGRAFHYLFLINLIWFNWPR